MTDSSIASSWAQFEDKVEAKGYAQISNALLRCPRISLQAKGFYALLKSYAWQDPATFPGVKRLCKDTGASDNTIKKYRDELIEAGLLEVKRRGRGKTNLYIFKSVAKFLESHTGAKQESHMPSDLESHTGANNEDSVDKDSEDNSTESTENRTETQQIMDEIYRALRNRKLRLTKEEYGYNLGRLNNVLKNDEPTDDELDALPKTCVDYFEWFGSLDIAKALRRYRQQKLRRVRETENRDKPATWEPVNPHGEQGAKAKQKPYPPFWYVSAFECDFDTAEQLIKSGKTHSEICEQLEAHVA